MDTTKIFASFKNVNLSNTTIIPHGISKIKNIKLSQKEKIFYLWLN